MEESYDKHNDGQEIFSKAVRAGKRTYFFDVKSTKGNDYYLTITESKKRFGDDGKFHYEKHKLFLYKEDFEKFATGLQEAIAHIRTLNGDHNHSFERNGNGNGMANGNGVAIHQPADVSFEDLGRD